MRVYLNVMIIYMRIIRLFIYHVIQRQLAAHNVDEHNFNSITLHQIKREKKRLISHCQDKWTEWSIIKMDI